MSRSKLSVFAAGATGVLVGSLFVVYLNLAGLGVVSEPAEDQTAQVARQTPADDAEFVKQVAAPEPVAQVDAVSPADDVRLSDLEQRMGTIADSLAGVQRELMAQKYEPEADWENESLIENAQDIEAMREYEYQRWEDKIYALSAEAVDRHWAPQARDAFESDAMDIATMRDLSIVDTDCRTTRCSVTVEWPSFVEAANSFSDFLHHDYQLKCAIETLLPEPPQDQLEQPYQMTVLYDCGDHSAPG